MNKFLKLFLPVVVIAFMISSCTDDDQVIVDDVLGQVFEVEVDFTAANNFAQVVQFPVSVFESDVVLVFLLEEVQDDGNGGTIDIFTPLSRSFFLDQGTVTYSFNHTFEDVALLLDADFDPALIPASFTDNQVFRIAIIPAEFAQAENIDVSNLSDVMSTLNIEQKNINKISL